MGQSDSCSPKLGTETQLWTLAGIVTWEPQSQRQPHSNKWAKKWRQLSGRGQNKAHKHRVAETETVRIPHMMLWFPGSRPILTLRSDETVRVHPYFKPPHCVQAYLACSLYSQLKSQPTASLLPLPTYPGWFYSHWNLSQSPILPCWKAPLLRISWGEYSIAQEKFSMVCLVGPCFIPSWAWGFSAMVSKQEIICSLSFL